MFEPESDPEADTASETRPPSRPVTTGGFRTGSFTVVKPATGRFSRGRNWSHVYGNCCDALWGLDEFIFLLETLFFKAQFTTAANLMKYFTSHPLSRCPPENQDEPPLHSWYLYFIGLVAADNRIRLVTCALEERQNVKVDHPNARGCWFEPSQVLRSCCLQERFIQCLILLGLKAQLL